MEAVETAAMIGHEDRHWWFRGRRRIIKDELMRIPLPSPARLLDAGCGSGRMLDALSEYGTVSGLEMRQDSVSLARRRGHDDVHEGFVERLPWGDDTFDLVVCLDVLEHTADDRVALQELRRVVRRGGHMLATVPAYQALWANHDVLNQHYRRYNRNSLTAAAGEAGWTVERITFFNSLLLVPAVAVRLIQRLRREPPEEHVSDLAVGPEWLYPALEFPLRAEASWLRRDHTLPAGLSLLAVLRR
jgi:SAM-dependent methyltransferase